jgi:hypothetical protein
LFLIIGIAVGMTLIVLLIRNTSPAAPTLQPISAPTFMVDTPPAQPTVVATAVPLTSAAVATTPVPGATPHTGPATYYVSPQGDGSDGSSWAKAWKSPAEVDWSVVQPADTVLLDGGTTSITYRTGITLTHSGAEGRPITLRVADEPGHNGQVVLFGGRSTPLPYCDQTDYVPQDAQRIGLEIDASWIVIDGGKWSGIIIYGFNAQGVSLDSISSHVTLRNLEIYDNGTLRKTDNGWRSDEKGVSLAGDYHTFERLLIHDNGQDEIQSGGKVNNFTLRDSWLYNERQHPIQSDRSFNYCTHSDGIQLWTGGVESGVTVEHSIIGPGLMQGLLLGEGSTNTVVNNVTVRDTLLIGASNANIHSHNTNPRNWLLERVTSIRGVGARNQNVFFTGAALTIRDSLFVGGVSMYVPKDGTYVNNCVWDVDGAWVGDKVDPNLGTKLDVTTLALPSGADFKPVESACVGSRLTSPAQLMMVRN